jgi:hypothetical protein
LAFVVPTVWLLDANANDTADNGGDIDADTDVYAQVQPEAVDKDVQVEAHGHDYFPCNLHKSTEGGVDIYVWRSEK